MFTAALLVCSGACKQEPTVEAPQPTAARATRAAQNQSDAFELDVLAVRDCEPPAYAKLDPNQSLLGVEVKLAAKTNGVPQNYYYGRVIDSEGQTYTAGFAGCEPRLAGTPLRDGETGRGFINFRLPRRAQQLTLEYAPRIGDMEKARGPKALRALKR